jgi:hypothetical protein
VTRCTDIGMLFLGGRCQNRSFATYAYEEANSETPVFQAQSPKAATPLKFGLEIEYLFADTSYCGRLGSSRVSQQRERRIHRVQAFYLCARGVRVFAARR